MKPADAGADLRAQEDAGADLRAQEDAGADLRAQEDAGVLLTAQELARQVIRALTARSQTLAVAESLTGGMLAATLTAIPGASAAFRGAVVAYAADVKAAVLDVPSGLLARHGAVHPDVAAAMAAGVRGRIKATAGVATTGVAGPDVSDGQPVGTVYIAVNMGRDTAVRALGLTGDRQQIRLGTVVCALRLLMDMLREDSA